MTLTQRFCNTTTTAKVHESFSLAKRFLGYIGHQGATGNLKYLEHEHSNLEHEHSIINDDNQYPLSGMLAEVDKMTVTSLMLIELNSE